MGHFAPIFFQFTKVKQKNEIHNICRENLRFNNLNLQFRICKSKTLNKQNGTFVLQIKICRTKSLQRFCLAFFS
jgi:hypothetical protein